MPSVPPPSFSRGTSPRPGSIVKPNQPTNMVRNLNTKTSKTAARKSSSGGFNLAEAASRRLKRM